MKRWSSMLLAVLVLALMGLARLPVPCLGDGHGHACTMERCACTMACTCKLACESMQASPHHACHMANMPHSKGPRHFALPDAPPPTVLGGLFRWNPNGRPDLGRPHSAPSLDAPHLPLPEPPPRAAA